MEGWAVGMSGHERCEAVIDVQDSSLGPHLIKCGKPAKIYGMAALCDDCAPKILERWKKTRP